MKPAVGEGELDFSGKYSKQKADEYHQKHQSSFGRRFSNRWEQPINFWDIIFKHCSLLLLIKSSLI